MNPEDHKVMDTINQAMTDSQYSLTPTSFHTHNGIDSSQVDFTVLVTKTRYALKILLDGSTSASVTQPLTGTFVFPFSGYIVSVGAYVDTAGTTGTMSIDINKNGTTIMANTQITIDTGKTDSRSSTTQPIVTTAGFVAVTDIFTFDIDVIQTTPAKGLTVFMNVVETP